MPVLGDFIVENCSTNDNGPLLLTGAVSGFNTFSSILADTDEAYYSIDDDGNKETGIGTYVLATNTLNRTTVHSTFISGVYDNTSPVAMALSGGAIVGCALSAQAYNAIDALKEDANVNIQDHITGQAILHRQINDAGTSTTELFSASKIIYEISTHTHSAIDGTITVLEESTIIVNQFFNTDTADWTKGTDWSIASGVATHASGTASSLSQAITVVTGEVYKLEYDVTAYTSGSVTPQLTGGTPVVGTAVSAVGTYIEYFTVNANTTLEFLASATLIASIDNIRIHKVNTITITDGIVSGLA